MIAKRRIAGDDEKGDLPRKRNADEAVVEARCVIARSRCRIRSKMKPAAPEAERPMAATRNGSQISHRS
jgi:hypothetical protein